MPNCSTGNKDEFTPSVKACGFATFPKGTALGGDGKVSGIVKRRPLGGAGTAQAVTEGGTAADFD